MAFFFFCVDVDVVGGGGGVVGVNVGNVGGGGGVDGVVVVEVDAVALATFGFHQEREAYSGCHQIPLALARKDRRPRVIDSNIYIYYTCTQQCIP